jgi:predicted metal-binding membrane protein
MSSDNFDFQSLDRSGRAAGRISARPALAVWIVLAAAIVLAWTGLAMLALRAVEVRSPGESLAGDGLLGGLASLPLPAFLDSFVALCLNPVMPSGSTPGQFLLTTAMWFLMAVAMMLPSAAPMVKTYCEIATRRPQKASWRFTPWCLPPVISRSGWRRRCFSRRSTLRSAR